MTPRQPGTGRTADVSSPTTCLTNPSRLMLTSDRSVGHPSTIARCHGGRVAIAATDSRSSLPLGLRRGRRGDRRSQQGAGVVVRVHPGRPGRGHPRDIPARQVRRSCPRHESLGRWGGRRQRSREWSVPTSLGRRGTGTLVPTRRPGANRPPGAHGPVARRRLGGRDYSLWLLPPRARGRFGPATPTAGRALPPLDRSGTPCRRGHRARSRAPAEAAWGSPRSPRGTIRSHRASHARGHGPRRRSASAACPGRRARTSLPLDDGRCATDRPYTRSPSPRSPNTDQPCSRTFSAVPPSRPGALPLQIRHEQPSIATGRSYRDRYGIRFPHERAPQHRNRPGVPDSSTGRDDLPN